MAIVVPGASRKVARRPAPVGPGHSRKIGIIGGAGSVHAAPWDDPSWEFWAHTSVVQVIPYLRADRLFDLHPKHVFQEQVKNGFKAYYTFLKTCPTPIYMQRVFEEIPQSIRYPREIVKAQWPGVPFGSTTSWMIALALMEGVTHLGFWGTDYAHATEYGKQRANAEHWAGIARGMGVQIILPLNTPFCREPVEEYGYESHSTPEKYAALKAEFAKAKSATGTPVGGFNAATLEMTRGPDDLERAAAIRCEKDPEWCRAIAQLKGEDAPSPDR